MPDQPSLLDYRPAAAPTVLPPWEREPVTLDRFPAYDGDPQRRVWIIPEEHRRICYVAGYNDRRHNPDFPDDRSSGLFAYLRTFTGQDGLDGDVGAHRADATRATWSRHIRGVTLEEGLAWMREQLAEASAWLSEPFRPVGLPVGARVRHEGQEWTVTACEDRSNPARLTLWRGPEGPGQYGRSSWAWHDAVEVVDG